jgi:RAB protein geranylgeranyltransferase component A
MSKEIAKKFFELVANMRAAQKSYFHARRTDKDQAQLYLRQSMLLEKEVDEIISHTQEKLKNH